MSETKPKNPTLAQELPDPPLPWLGTSERAGVKVVASSPGTTTIRLEGATDLRDGWYPIRGIEDVSIQLVEGERARREVVALRRLLWLVLMAGAAPGETVRRIDIPDSALVDWDEGRAELTEWPDMERLGITIQARLLHPRTCRCNGTGSVRVAVQTPAATPMDPPSVAWRTVPCPG